MPDKQQTTQPVVIDRRRSGWIRRVARFAAPVAVGVVMLVVWEGAVRWFEIAPYVFPAPSAVGRAMLDNRGELFAAWCVTFGAMCAALAAAVIGGVLLAALFASSRILEVSFFPYAVVLQVTPLVALAPLLMVITPETPGLVRFFCAAIVAFFPVLANTVVGLRSADPGLRDLFRLYGASRLDRVRLLLAPSALPYFLAGLRVAVNLALVGAVVAEFVTGAGTENPGVATLVFAGQYLSDGPLAFAALATISLTGIAMYFATHLLSRWLLRGWHASSLEHENR